MAIVLWYIVFDFPKGIFWAKMAVATPILAAISLTQIVPRRKDFRAFRPRHLLIGIGSAAFLYGIFYAGNILLPLLVPESHRMVASVYATGRALPIGLLRCCFSSSRVPQRRSTGAASSSARSANATAACRPSLRRQVSTRSFTS